MSAAFGGQSMAATLKRVLVCAPEVAGWGDEAHASPWRDLGYFRPPAPEAARREHAALRQALLAAGCDITDLDSSDGLTLDAVYTHDASFMTDRGAILLRMGKPARAAEPLAHARLYASLGIPVLGAIEPPGTVEGGDLVWLDEATVLAGRGFRTNDSGIDQLRSLLAPARVEVIGAPLPYGRGPGCCLHLMSLLSVVGERSILVDLAWLAVETVDLLRARGFAFLEIDPAERDTLACNVLALGDRRLVAFGENPKTRATLERGGFSVTVVPGSELGGNGGGGPTCLTRPLLRSRARA